MEYLIWLLGWMFRITLWCIAIGLALGAISVIYGLITGKNKTNDLQGEVETTKGKLVIGAVMVAFLVCVWIMLTGPILATPVISFGTYTGTLTCEDTATLCRDGSTDCRNTEINLTCKDKGGNIRSLDDTIHFTSNGILYKNKTPIVDEDRPLDNREVNVLGISQPATVATAIHTNKQDKFKYSSHVTGFMKEAGSDVYQETFYSYEYASHNSIRCFIRNRSFSRNEVAGFEIIYTGVLNLQAPKEHDDPEASSNAAVRDRLAKTVESINREIAETPFSLSDCRIENTDGFCLELTEWNCGMILSSIGIIEFTHLMSILT